MSPEQIRELWSRFLSGEKLSAEAQKELVEALDADSELRDSLLENLQLDGMLRALDTTRRHGEAFVRTMTECVGAEHDATRFIEKVELRLNEPEPPAPASAGTGRRTKPPTTRVFRRRSAASAPGESAWKPALIAAAALLVILLLVTSPKPAPTVAKVPPKPPAPAPVDPEPPRAPDRPQNEPIPPKPPIPERTPDLKPNDTFKPPAPPPTEESAVREGEKPKVEPSKPKPETTPSTVPAPVIVHTVVEQIEKDVYLARTPADKRRAKKDEPVPVGVAVETPGATSTAVLRFEDKTWVEVGPNSSFKELQSSSAPGGRRVLLSFGTLDSHIEKQSAERPMVFLTPNAETTIVGTTVRLTVTHDQKGTLLEVKEGKVIFTRLLDRKPVEVVTGQFVVAAAGAELVPQKSFPDDILVKFGPADVQVKTGQVLDSGEEFDAKRGYGWKGRKDGDVIPGMTWKDPSTGRIEPKRSGRSVARRLVPPNTTPDPLRNTDVVAGWGPHFETWSMPVPNGRYLVTVCCGDISFEQGPHHVAVEGVQVIEATKNKAGQFVERSVPVDVKDGELTMIVGGYTGPRVSIDRSSDTIINFLKIQRIRK